jgi:hypothetical protein
MPAMPQWSRRPDGPWSRVDGVAELDCLGRCRHPAGHGGGVQEIPNAGGVERLPAAGPVEHLADVGDEHMVVGQWVTGS